MIKRTVALSAVLAAALSTTALAGLAMAQDKPVQLKLSHWVPPSHPLQGSMQAWAASIQKASGGTITSALFPAEQLGKAFDHYDMARDGIADVTYVNPGYQPGRFPIIAAGELPFTFADAKNGTAALDAWYRKYAAAEMKDVHFCMAFIHDPGAIHARKKVVTPDDIKGLKVRPANATIGQMVTLLGGTNVQASAPESRDMLERGVADAITFPWGSVILFGIDKVVKYHLDAPLYATTFVWVMNKAKYDGMSPAQKKVMDDHCNNDWAVRVATPWADFEASGRDRIRNMSGHEMIKLTPEQLGQWRTAIEPLNKLWADGVRKTGGNPDEIAAELKESVAKYKAGL
ncbi:MAG: TRAP transporter substrate-binding protein [Alphaproteobacteria bacterium]|jgi:TRAP-type C4-dicarboxylate transport system substrate-binding protein|nr:TRAP transporter substrate-binding protein [Alphaproteobacteria bacterium]